MEEYYARIEDYLDNALTEAERAAFELELQSNQTLATALEHLRETRERLARQWAQQGDEAELRNTLKDLGQQHFGGKQTVARRVAAGNWWRAAAAVAAILVVWFVWPAGDEGLYERFRQFPEAGFAEKGSNEQTLAEAEKAFNAKDYDKALDALNAYSEAQPEDLQARLFAGLCQLELDQLSQAETTFRRILSTPNSWSGEARWYLALTFLKREMKEECKEVLKQVLPDEAHYTEAQALLKRLNR